MGVLALAPSRLLGFDGENDYISIDNSDVVGNPYDLGRTDAFSFAGVFHNNGRSRDNIRFFDKRTSNSGYIFGTATTGLLLIGFNTSAGLQGMLAGSGYGTSTESKSFCIGTYDGSGNANGFIIYLYTANGSYSATISIGSGTGGVTGSADLGVNDLKNSTSVVVGRNYPTGTALYTKASLAHLSMWNKVLTRTESDSLVNKMLNDTVNTHSVYSANCIGYWREFAGTRAINAVNPIYNGTIIGQ